MNQWWPKSFSSLIFLLIALATNALAQQPQPFAPDKMETVLYGVAYCPEYMPYDRLDQDIELMRKAGITVVRVGESTWSSWEPREGDFQFAWMQRVLDRLQRAGIKAILGTPTYSIPTWLYKQHPEIVVTHNGVAPPLSDPYSPSYPPALTPGFYGPRQNYDFLNPYFRQAAEGVIRQIISHFKDHPAVIGYQIDNETFPTGIPTRYMNAGGERFVVDLIADNRSEEHTSELQSRLHLVCRLLLEKRINYVIALFRMMFMPSPISPGAPRATGSSRPACNCLTSCKTHLPSQVHSVVNAASDYNTGR